MVWLRVFEVWLTARLLASPTFHRGVKKVHKKVHEIRTGQKVFDPSEQGGTQIDTPPASAKKFMKHFMEEVKDQFRGTTTKK